MVLQLVLFMMAVKEGAAQFTPLGLIKLAIQNMTSTHQLLGETPIESLSCGEALKLIMSNDEYQEDQTRIFVTSGMQANDLGLYDSCLDNGNLTYATVIVRQKQDATSGDIRFTKREVIFGLCVPKQCDTHEKLQFLNNIY
jgi:hypothetical protein